MYNLPSTGNLADYTRHQNMEESVGLEPTSLSRSPVFKTGALPLCQLSVWYGKRDSNPHKTASKTVTYSNSVIPISGCGSRNCTHEAEWRRFYRPFLFLLEYTAMEQIKRIELLTSGWRPEVLPLNYTCMALSAGLEPTTYWLTASCSTFELQECKCYRQDLNLQLPGQ